MEKEQGIPKSLLARWKRSRAFLTPYWLGGKRAGHSSLPIGQVVRELAIDIIMDVVTVMDISHG